MNRVKLIIVLSVVFFLGILLGVRVAESGWRNRLEAYKAVCAPNRDNDLYKTFGCDKSDFDAIRVKNGWEIK